jgi:hypothetical protein
MIEKTQHIIEAEGATFRFTSNSSLTDSQKEKVKAAKEVYFVTRETVGLYSTPKMRLFCCVMNPELIIQRDSPDADEFKKKHPNHKLIFDPVIYSGNNQREEILAKL